MAADFLCIYPEFRGDSPQLEPSPTYHRPESAEFLEALYWRILRERARERLTNPGAATPEQTLEVWSEAQDGDLVHDISTKRHLPIPRPRRRLEEPLELVQRLVAENRGGVYGSLATRLICEPSLLTRDRHSEESVE